MKLPSLFRWRKTPAGETTKQTWWRKRAQGRNARLLRLVADRNPKHDAEILRENKRLLDKAIRELDRERASLQKQEKQIIVDIRKNAQQNQMGAVKVMAKSLIRTRHSITKFYALRSQLQAVSLRIQTMKSTQTMAQAMKGVTKAMGQMNRKMNLPAIQRIMREFEMQNERMEMSSDFMSDAMDDAFEEEDEEEETEELVNQVLDEIGCNLNTELVQAPAGGIGAKAAERKAQLEEPASLDGDLEARLQNLRKM